MTNTYRNGLRITAKKLHNPLAIVAFNYRHMSYNRHFYNGEKNREWEKSPIWGMVFIGCY